MVLSHFLGSLSLKIQGDNTLEFVNKVKFLGIHTKKLYTKNNSVFMEIYSGSYKKIEATAFSYEMEVSTLKKMGLYWKIYPYRKRFGVVLGGLIGVVIVFLLSNITFQIRVSGVSSEVENSILSVLRNHGVTAGSYIPNMNFNSLENQIMLALDEVDFVAIRNSGSIIFVNASESVEQPKMLLTRIPCNIVSAEDAVISDVKVYAGKLEVLLGEGVKKGDILVSGTVPNTRGDTFFYHSHGEIIGTFSRTVTFEQEFSEEVTTVSNTGIKKNYFNIFSLSIPIEIPFFSKDLQGQEYKIEENIQEYSFFSLKLPFGKVEKIFYPIEKELVEYTKFQAVENLEKQLTNYEQNFLKEYEIVSRSINGDFLSDKIVYYVEYTLKGNIGILQEIYIDF